LADFVATHRGRHPWVPASAAAP